MQEKAEPKTLKGVENKAEIKQRKVIVKTDVKKWNKGKGN